MYMSNVHNMRQRLDSLYRSFEGECSILDSVVSGKEDAYRTVYSPEVERDELRIRDSAGFTLMRMQLLSLALGDEMPVLNYPLSKLYGAEDEYLLLQGDSTHCDPVLLFAHQCAEAVSIIRNTMTRLLELLDAGIPIEGVDDVCELRRAARCGHN